MTKTTHTNQTIAEVASKLNAIAAAETIKGRLFMEDVKYAINGANSWDLCQCNTPYYIAFRNCGVENGSKDEVKSRCATLGQPHIAVQLTHENGAITMKINSL